MGAHPPGFGDQHPWLDPLAPQDLFNPRPDGDLAMAGHLAPDPRTYPYTPEGRAAYYADVRSAANQQMQQMHHLGQLSSIRAAEARRVGEEAAEAERTRTNLLLLGP